MHGAKVTKVAYYLEAQYKLTYKLQPSKRTSQQIGIKNR